MTLKTLRVRPQEHKNVTEEVKKSRRRWTTAAGLPPNRRFQAQGLIMRKRPQSWKGLRA